MHYAKSVIATLEGLAFFTHFGIAVRVVSLPLVIQHAPSYAYGSVPVCINGAILATSPFHAPLDQSQFVRMDIIDLFRLVLRPGALTWGYPEGHGKQSPLLETLFPAHGWQTTMVRPSVAAVITHCDLVSGCTNIEAKFPAPSFSSNSFG